MKVEVEASDEEVSLNERPYSLYMPILWSG